MYWVLEPFGSGQLPPIILILSSLMGKVVAKSEEEASIQGRIIPQKLTVFHGLRAPSIGIKSYLERIFKYANCSPSCFVVAYAYIDRFIHQKHMNLAITSLNVHRLLITSIMVAAKFLDDAHFDEFYEFTIWLPDFDLFLAILTVQFSHLSASSLRLFSHLECLRYYNNAYYAKVGGVTTLEMNTLELEFLFRLGFRMHITDKAQKRQQQMTVWCSYAGV
eukprot:Gb_39399 [translate_table: standard]